VLAFGVGHGIGIEPDKQRLIFEASSRPTAARAAYGGTGLGLAISRELSRLLGGELRLDSAPGRGSVFTLYLPLEPVDAVPALRPAMEAPPLTAPVAAAAPPDDRALLGPDDRVLLVVEDDPAFAQVLAELGRERGFKVVVATRGADALATAREVRPDAITFDVGLPDVDGWRLLDRLKEDPETRHIPVFLVSAADDPERSLGRGAVGFVSNPRTQSSERSFAAARDRGEDRQNLIVLDPDPRGRPRSWSSSAAPTWTSRPWAPRPSSRPSPRGRSTAWS
jgi:CheY-like chemotaxis protein